MAQEYSILYPWQILRMERSIPRRRAGTPQNYKEWNCAFPGCPIKINDLETKNRKAIYCPFHKEHMKKLSERNRYQRYITKKRQEKAMRTFADNIRTWRFNQ